MDNGQNLVRANHLEDVANGAKRYTLREILEVTNAVTAELESINVDFTGATSISGGLSGMVPAPNAGDQKHFLRGDGTWARTDEGAVVLDTVASGVEGALWKSTVNDIPVLKLRHGDYEYNFHYDDVVAVSGASSAVATVEPDTYILGNNSVSSEGGLWYEVSATDVPKLWFHSGNFNYGVNYSTITYKGGNQNLVCYLPFDSSTTADACRNEWQVYGSPTIAADENSFSGKALSLNGSSYLFNPDISALIGSSPWTIDFWATSESNNVCTFFGTGISGNNSMVALCWDFGYIMPKLPNSETRLNLSFTLKRRYHYAMTYDGTNVRVFVDGDLKFTQPKEIILGGDFVIGADKNKNYQFSGNIDHFRIFNAVLWVESFTPPTASDYL